MGQLIIVEGPMGTGKSTAWEEMPAENCFIIKPNTKLMPFMGSRAKFKHIEMDASGNMVNGGNVVQTNMINDIGGWLMHVSNHMPHIKYLLLEDFSHYLTARTLSPNFMAQSTGEATFKRWAQFAADIQNNIFAVIPGLRPDLIIVMNHHVVINEHGLASFKTSGKLLEREISPPSHVEVLLHTHVIERSGEEARYVFITNRDGLHEAKSPRGMFPRLYIPNNMAYVVQVMAAYEAGDKAALDALHAKYLPAEAAANAETAV